MISSFIIICYLSIECQMHMDLHMIHWFHYKVNSQKEYYFENLDYISTAS